MTTEATKTDWRNQNVSERSQSEKAIYCMMSTREGKKRSGHQVWRGQRD
jgi:hypothetical protein